jgi:hypothetical protein
MSGWSLFWHFSAWFCLLLSLAEVVAQVPARTGSLDFLNRGQRGDKAEIGSAEDASQLPVSLRGYWSYFFAQLFLPGRWQAFPSPDCFIYLLYRSLC